MAQDGVGSDTTAEQKTGVFARGLARVKDVLTNGAHLLVDVLEKRAAERQETYGAIVQQFTARTGRGGGLSGLKPLSQSASVFQRTARAPNPRAENAIAAIEAAMQAREKAGRSRASNLVIGK